MNDWARELIDSMQGIAEVFDRGDPAKPFSAALAVQAAKVQDVALTPSARMLAELESTGESFFDLGLRMSRLHKEYFLALYPPNVGAPGGVPGRGRRVPEGAGRDRGRRSNEFRTVFSGVRGGLKTVTHVLLLTYL